VSVSDAIEPPVLFFINPESMARYPANAPSIQCLAGEAAKREFFQPALDVERYQLLQVQRDRNSRQSIDVW
jgi:hypothetical protein